MKLVMDDGTEHELLTVLKEGEKPQLWVMQERPGENHSVIQSMFDFLKKKCEAANVEAPFIVMVPHGMIVRNIDTLQENSIWVMSSKEKKGEIELHQIQNRIGQLFKNKGIPAPTILYIPDSLTLTLHDITSIIQQLAGMAQLFVDKAKEALTGKVIPFKPKEDEHATLEAEAPAGAAPGAEAEAPQA